MNSLNFVALKTIWIKECTRFLRIWIQTLVPPAITMSLYFVIFGNLIGKRIGEMGGFSYMEFIVPGLIMMSIITNSYSNVSSSFFSAKFQRNVEELLVAPVPTWVIIMGFVGGGVARAMIIGVIVTCVSMFFVDVQIYNFFVQRPHFRSRIEHMNYFSHKIGHILCKSQKHDQNMSNTKTNHSNRASRNP